jgi:hypothetical protein
MGIINMKEKNFQNRLMTATFLWRNCFRLHWGEFYRKMFD